MALDLEFRGRWRASVMSVLALALLLGAGSGMALAQRAGPPGSQPKAIAPGSTKAAPPKAVAPVRPTASEVSPDGQMLLVPGRELKLTMVNGAPVPASEGPAPADSTTAGNPAATLAQWTASGPGDLPREPGVVIFKLYVDPARGSKLVVSNGSSAAVIYEAVLLITRDGSSDTVPVNTCSVPAGSAAVEFWAGLQVDFVQVPKFASTPNPICFDPAANKFYSPAVPPPSSSVVPITPPR